MSAISSRRTPIDRPADLLGRIAETELAIATLKSAGLRPLYPSPAALQLYALGDQLALNEARAPGADRPPYAYVERPLEDRGKLRRMSDALRNASLWLGETLETQLYARTYGMRRQFRMLERLLRQQTAYELAALRPGIELTSARMARVADLWAASRPEPLRTVSVWERELKSWNAEYRRPQTAETRSRLRLRFESLARDFRQTAYKTAFLQTLEQTRDGPPPQEKDESADVFEDFGGADGDGDDDGDDDDAEDIAEGLRQLTRRVDDDEPKKSVTFVVPEVKPEPGSERESVASESDRPRQTPRSSDDGEDEGSPGQAATGSADDSANPFDDFS